jgi:type II secretory pathway pseudopilin PulG
MAALLVAITVMSVLMTVAMPVWKQMSQREKEAELVFRGQQYTRAISLFQRKTGPGVLPPNLDVLVDQKFLRKKYKDPITGEDFLLIPGAVAAGAQAQIQALQSQVQTLGRGSQTATPAASAASAGYVAQGSPFGTNVPGGITGVVSKSTDTSLRVYNGRTHYNEWEFRFIPPPPPPQPQGGAGGGRGVPQRGGTGVGAPDARGGRGPQFGTPPAPGARGVTYTLGPDGRIVATPNNPDGRGSGAPPSGTPPAGRGPVNIPPPGR